MASLSVVGREPGCEGSGVLVVVGVGLAVGPLALEGAVEALDLAVLPGAVGADQEVGRADALERCGESSAVGVGPVVCRSSPLDRNAMRGEALDGPVEDADAVAAFSSGRISE